MQLAEQNRLLGSEGKNTLLLQTAQSFPCKVRLSTLDIKKAREIADWSFADINCNSHSITGIISIQLL